MFKCVYFIDQLVTSTSVLVLNFSMMLFIIEPLTSVAAT